MKIKAAHCLYLSILPFLIASSAAAPGKPVDSPGPKGLAASDWNGIRAAHEAGRHAFRAVEGGWQASNPGQQWSTRFDGRGFTAKPLGGSWEWGLELRSYGFPGAEQHYSRPAVVRAEGQRLAAAWDSRLEEWLVNDQRGLEHGFTVRERPRAAAGSPAPLQFTLAIRGPLQPKIASDAQGVLFHDDSGAIVLNYTGLKVWDRDGKVLSSRFELAGDLLRLSVEEKGASYPITIDPIAQQAYLKPSAVGTTQAGDEFGFSVAISGDTAVVGAPREDSSTTGVVNAPNISVPNESASDSGAVYVFLRVAGVWTQQAYLKPNAVGTTQQGDFFGRSVAIDGNTIVVGAPYEDSSTTGAGSSPNDDGTAGNSGAAYVFERVAGAWTQQAYLKPFNVGSIQANDQFGWSVSVSGDTVIVGAPNEDSSNTGVDSSPNESAGNSGAAYVFVRGAGVWGQQSYLKPLNVGTTQAGDQFGWSVGISGDTVIVGAYAEDSSTILGISTPNEIAIDSGAAYIFTRSFGSWTQQAYLKPAAVGTKQDGDYFGGSVAISGDTAVVGASLEDSNTTGVINAPNVSAPNEGAFNSGAAYVFVRSGASWTQQAYLKPQNVGTPQTDDLFGNSVAVSGDRLVVGANFEGSNTLGTKSTPSDSNPPVAVGAAYVFLRSAGTWEQLAYLKPAAVGSTQVDDRFGQSVAVSDETVVVGANYEDGGATGVNQSPNESSPTSGAAYVFTDPLRLWRQANFGTRENIGTAANEADTESDGWKNLLEYGLVTNPTLHGETGISLGLQTYASSQYLRSIFTRDPARNDVTISVQVSDSPAGPWTTVARSICGAVTSGAGFVSETDIGGGLKQVEVRDTVPSTAAVRRFLRIIVE